METIIVLFLILNLLIGYCLYWLTNELAWSCAQVDRETYKPLTLRKNWNLICFGFPLILFNLIKEPIQKFFLRVKKEKEFFKSDGFVEFSLRNEKGFFLGYKDTRIKKIRRIKDNKLFSFKNTEHLRQVKMPTNHSFGFWGKK